MDAGTEKRDVRVGEEAPDFVLDDENGNKVRLSDLRGQPVVLIFYPFDWSGTCTKELCSIRDNSGDWEETGARVFGISRAWSLYQFFACRDPDLAQCRHYGIAR